MEDNIHDPSEYIRGIQQILISDKKKIGFLFGAGTSVAKKESRSLSVPAVNQMTTEVLKELVAEFKADGQPNINKEIYSKVFSEIKIEITEEKFNIERILSNLEQKLQVIGGGQLNGLNKTQLSELITTFKEMIRQKVSVHSDLENTHSEFLIQSDLAEWIGQVNRRCPIEIFTTNYDYLFELGLEHHNVSYYTGFSGSYRPFFSSESVEDINFLPDQTKLWKLHGSLGWHHDEVSGKVTRRDSTKKDILIYPSILKYNDSKKQPYTSLMDRLSLFLKQDDSILITCGYAFGDEHINEKIISMLKTTTTSHVVALYYDKTIKDGKPAYELNSTSPVAKLAKECSKISVYGHRSAVIGCKFGNWVLRKEPSSDDTLNVNLYFDEDGPVTEEEKVGLVPNGQKLWTGRGNFFLPDFSKFVAFLRAMTIHNEIKKIGLNEK